MLVFLLFYTSMVGECFEFSKSLNSSSGSISGLYCLDLFSSLTFSRLCENQTVLKLHKIFEKSLVDLLAKQNLCFYWLFRNKNNTICASFLMVKRALKSIVICRIWKSKAFGTIAWPCYLDKHTKFRFPAVKNALWALESICAPTERHILIAHAITNKDFGACSFASCSPWKMAQHS